jgi:putative DNA-invertase from lambdoid prophage Rac
MAVYAYTRVSTRAQSEDGESLGVQERQIAGYALMQGWTVGKVYVERGVSGSVPLVDRPKGSAMLAQLGAGDVVIAAKLDRAFRDAGDALATMKSLKERGVALHLIDLGGNVCDGGIAKLVFTILAAVAEQERDRIRERVSVVKKDQKARGRYLGGRVPFGYRTASDGSLEPVPEQQAAISTARSMRAAGIGLESIRGALAEQGTTLSMGALWKLVSVAA